MAHSYLDPIVQNALGGIIATGSLGCLAYWRAKVPDVSGVWTMEVNVQKSDYNPFLGMKLTYIMMLTQRSGDLEGVAEKVHEISKKNPAPGYFYQKRGRMHSYVKGGVKGNIFQRKDFQLLLREQGQNREFISTADIQVKHGNLLRGSYISTAANSSGSIVLTRGIRKGLQWSGG
ncbi:hypothetical protein [Xanthomonas campestris]|uniref:hypothetical protein n=1 Tax=Xanthomonas campestris TaxID=339 RepID=UPI0011C04523|nr:hypothetical protein [Xanthomonas campestris]